MPGGIRLQMGIIKPCRKKDRKGGKSICLYSKSRPNKLLGRHRSLASARRQEQAIQVRRRKGS